MSIGQCSSHIPHSVHFSRFATKAIGEEVRYNDVSPETYRGFEFAGAEDLGNMFQFKRDFEHVFCGARDVGRARALNPSL